MNLPDISVIAGLKRQTSGLLPDGKPLDPDVLIQPRFVFDIIRH
jgi:hypothetical protein